MTGLSLGDRGRTDRGAATQQAFRNIMTAMSRPCAILPLSFDGFSTGTVPAVLLPSTAAVLLTLCDYETSIWLDENIVADGAVAGLLAFETGARIAPSAAACDLAVTAASRLPALSAFKQGTPEYPDRSSTVIVQCERLFSSGFCFRGPGIRGEAGLSADGLPADFASQLQLNRATYPCGVDLLFISPTQIAALPRSVCLVGEA